jgi:peptidoglycan-N-acetylglucosamine deacetylase
MDSGLRTRSITAVCALVALLTGCGAPRSSERRQSEHQSAEALANPVTVDFTEAQIKQSMSVARFGKKLTPKTWPNGARVAVCLSFDVDNELLQRENPLPVPLSVGEYGATTSLPRILNLLDRHSVPATFFMPAMSSMLHPEMVPSILTRHRHEIGVHGWIHEFWPGIGDAAKEEKLLKRSIT